MALIVSVNLHRRHLTAGQKAAVGVEIKTALEAEAKERQRKGKSSDGATQVTAYVSGDKNNCGQIVIAAAGNEDGPVAFGWVKQNLLADQSFVRGQPTSALTNAVQKEADIVQQVASNYPTAQITLTGVSEGGGISEIVGDLTNLQTVTFIAPGTLPAPARLRVIGAMTNRLGNCSGPS